MVIIKFKNGTDWYKANWAFRRIANDVVARSPDDHDIGLIMEAQAFGALDFISMEKSRAAKVLNAIRMVIEETLQGRLPGWKKEGPDDTDGHRMYREAIEELLDLIRKEAAELR